MITAFVRTIILYFLIVVGMRLMGKRQIGELEPSELVLTMMISDLATVPMQDFGIPLLTGVVPILALLAMTMILSVLTMKSIRFRALLCGRPSVVIRRGEIDQGEMRRNRLTVDELLEELRSQGYTDPQKVEYAILETNGQLSVGRRRSRPPWDSWDWRPRSPGCRWCSSVTGGCWSGTSGSGAMTGTGWTSSWSSGA